MSNTPQYIKINKHGDKFYYKNEQKTILHREDGPAMEFASGKKYWFVNSIQLTEEEFNKLKIAK